MKKIASLLVVMGLLVTLLSIFGDLIGLGQRGNVGAAQFLGIQLGIGTILLGIAIGRIGIGTIRQLKAGLQDALSGLPYQPPAFWVLFTFFIMYLVFFLFPVFLNPNLEIKYLSDYIPDQGRIGFDIRAIVNRIDAWFVMGLSPYADGFVAYPPLTIALFTPFTLIGYPGYFQLMTFATISCYVISTLIIPLLIAGKKYTYMISFLCFTGLFSYGFQFELERGQFNIIAFTICMLAIFLYHTHPEFRYWAYLLFSFSVQMKVYPIFFIVMFIRDWQDWKHNAKRFLTLGGFNFLLLFVLGYKMFRDFLKAIFAYQFDYESNRHENLSIKGFVHSLASGDIPLVSENAIELFRQNTLLLELSFFALLGICFTLIIANAHHNKLHGLNPYLLVVCTISSLVIPAVSNDYKLSILAAPVAILMTNLPIADNLQIKMPFNLLIAISSAAYWSTLYPFSIKPDVLSRNFPILVILLITITLLSYYLRPIKSATSPSIISEHN